jgi:hypothetical protein
MSHLKQHWVKYVGGYLVLAFVYNRYVATPGGFMLPGDVIGMVI